MKNERHAPGEKKITTKVDFCESTCIVKEKVTSYNININLANLKKINIFIYQWSLHSQKVLETITSS